MSDLAVVEKKETRGRPKLPENVIKDLEAEIAKLKDTLAHKDDSFEEMKQLAEIVRIVQRAMKGLGSEENEFYGLIDVKDIRERTRLDETTLLSHSAMRVAASQWSEFALMLKLADMEDPYFISQDGEGRREAILQSQAKAKLDGNMILNMPNTQGGVAQNPEINQAPQKKQGLFNKIKGRF